MITPVNFCGKNTIVSMVKKNSPLSAQDKNVAKMAIKYHEIKPDISSDGAYVSDKEKDVYSETMKAIALAKTPFAYKAALDLTEADANEAICYAKSGFQKSAKEIAKTSPEISKDMILDDLPLLVDYDRFDTPLKKYTDEEIDLLNKLDDFLNAEVFVSGDGNYLSLDGENKADEFFRTLAYFTGVSSRVGYDAAVKAMNSAAVKEDATHFGKAELIHFARIIAQNTPEITKEEICRDLLEV